MGQTCCSAHNKNNQELKLIDHFQVPEGGKFLQEIPKKSISSEVSAIIKQLNQKNSEKIEKFNKKVKLCPVYQFNDQSIYQGYWSEQKKHGLGVLYYPNGSLYQGEFETNCRNGYGIYIKENGDYYEGEWVNNQFSGKGNYYWLDGRTFSGCFKNGLRHGKGEFRWPDQKKYTGQWENGQLNFLYLTRYNEGPQKEIVKSKQINSKNNIFIESFYLGGSKILENEEKNIKKMELNCLSHFRKQDSEFINLNNNQNLKIELEECSLESLKDNIKIIQHFENINEYNKVVMYGRKLEEFYHDLLKNNIYLSSKIKNLIGKSLIFTNKISEYLTILEDMVSFNEFYLSKIDPNILAINFSLISKFYFFLRLKSKISHSKIDSHQINQLFLQQNLEKSEKYAQKAEKILEKDKGNLDKKLQDCLKINELVRSEVEINTSFIEIHKNQLNSEKLEQIYQKINDKFQELKENEQIYLYQFSKHYPENYYNYLTITAQISLSLICVQIKKIKEGIYISEKCLSDIEQFKPSFPQQNENQALILSNLAFFYIFKNFHNKAIQKSIQALNLDFESHEAHYYLCVAISKFLKNQEQKNNQQDLNNEVIQEYNQRFQQSVLHLYNNMHYFSQNFQEKLKKLVTIQQNQKKEIENQQEDSKKITEANSNSINKLENSKNSNKKQVISEKNLQHSGQIQNSSQKSDSQIKDNQFIFDESQFDELLNFFQNLF